MSSFIEKLRNPLKLKLFFLTKLPMALIAGLKIGYLDNEKSVVTIKYGYLTQNPFKSLYFACLAMAAELASGVLVLSAVHHSNQMISTLVTAMDAEFTKKAVGKISFTCEDGDAINEIIQQTINTKNGVILKTKSVGKDELGDIVAVFHITWSMKAKKVG
jgi:hypothetical protein